LSVIASRNATTVTKIKELNQLTSDVIYVGQILKIPTTTTVTEPAPVTTSPTVPTPVVTTITYTVVSGDSLSVIAKRYNTTVTAIKTENQLTTDVIYVGQKLKITTTTP
jgi:LysM repeat protein